MKPSELLRTKGWCQGVIARKEDGISCASMDQKAANYCAYGVINFCYGENMRAWSDAIDRVNSKIAPYLFISNNPIVNWNDAPGRTKEEVIALLEECGL